MKLGLILECPPNGTDHQVYDYIVRKLCPSIEIFVLPTGTSNKPQMIENCGKIASSLLELESCDVVAIIWDLMPPWEKQGEKACRHEDIDKIQTNLKNANVDLSKIKLICIEPELEGWIITEGSALTKYKKTICGTHPIKKFNKKKDLSTFKDSKKILSKYLGRKYNDTVDAIKIVKHIDDFGKIARKHKSFARLKNFIEQFNNLCVND
ncbi:MAG: hypothetical protein LBP87_03540 [Planctomycetaceae bacterium]|jgi:hypothetical protein|nr:hypothetical protein [Planctomycetaceae bacterium]